MINKIIYTLVLVMIVTPALLAEEQLATGSLIRIEGRKSATVNQQNIRLSDIAEIKSDSMKDADIIIALQKIVIDPSPQPGESTTLSASRILERLKQEGVKLSEIIYTFPRVLKVDRAARVLTSYEVSEALKRALKEQGRDLNIRQVNYNENIKVAPSFGNLKADIFQSAKAGEIAFTLKGETDGNEEQQFNLTAQVDQWINIPIAGQYITKGSKIKAEDLVMARMNAAALPMDTFHSQDEVIGKEVVSDIQYGESFRKNKLNIPAAVLNGSKVVLTYKVGSLEATATGIAQEAGQLGQEIKVKNESSKKIVIGKVIEPGIVGVNP